MTQASMRTLFLMKKLSFQSCFDDLSELPNILSLQRQLGWREHNYGALCSVMATVVPREGQVPEGFETGCILFSAFCTYMIFGNVAFRQPPIKNIFKEVPWKIVMENMRIF